MWIATKFSGDQRGATTVEFALVGVAFIATVMFVMAAAMIMYFNQTIDNATSQAARQILTGATQKQSTPATLDSFKQEICRYLPTVLSCDNLVVNLYVIPKSREPGGYFPYMNFDKSGLVMPALKPGSGQFNLGNQGDYQYLQVIYPLTFLPPFVSSWIGNGATFNGKPAYLAISGAAFRNERF